MKVFKIFTAAFLLIAVVSLPSISSANVSQFVFVTSPQTIYPDTFSDVITIQSQDSSGTKENIANTMYVTVTSSSATGQFFSNTTGGSLAVQVTMSKNSANKNFYYRDTTLGTHKLNVAITDTKGSPSIFSADQDIVIGSASSASTTVNTTNSSSNSGSSTSTNEETSAHSSFASLSTVDKEMEFEISGGRSRLTTVGSPVQFKVVPTKLQIVSEQGITYQWSFGDGTTGIGNAPSHTYKFPGEYDVVVNGAYSDETAVSRLQVKVVSPNVLIERVAGGLQVTNKSGVEINLEGWSLVKDPSSRAKLTTGQAFVFPKDTLIPSGKKIIFANEVTGVDSSAVQLLNPVYQELARVSGEVPLSEEISTSVSLHDLQAKLDEAKIKLAQLSPAITPKSEPTITVKTLESKSELALATSTIQTAVVFEAPARTGIVTSIFSWPIIGFNFIKHLFVEE